MKIITSKKELIIPHNFKKVNEQSTRIANVFAHGSQLFALTHSNLNLRGDEGVSVLRYATFIGRHIVFFHSSMLKLTHT